MSSKPKNPKHRDEPASEDSVLEDGHELEEEQDDAVIGQAFKRSLLVFAAIGLVIAGVLFLRSRPDAAAPEQVIERAAPEVPNRGDIAPPSLPFVDVTTEAGVDFVHENGARGDKLLPESMGAGVALFDYDGDDDADLLLVNSMAWSHDAGANAAQATSRLYRNDSSAGALRLTDVSEETGIDQLTLYGSGVAVGDVDGDGYRDLFVTAVGHNRLLLGSASGRFEDATAAAGVAGDAAAWSTTAAFFDADRDGDLDLFVGNYVQWSKEIDYQIDYRLTGVGRAYGPPVNYQGTFSSFYRNDTTAAGAPRFTDLSEPAGIQVRNPATDVPVGKALGLLPIDADRDGWTDLLVVNDTVRNFFFHNQGARGESSGDEQAITFEEVGELWGVAYGRSGEATGGMGIDAGFLLGNDDLGFAIGNFANEMTSLYLAQGDPTLYADDAIGLGIGAPSRSALTFGLLMLDADLDGRLDMIQTNGHLENEINSVDPSQTYAQPSQLFWNAGPDARQPLVALAADAIGDLAAPLVGRGSAFADLDGDGDLDVVLTQTGRRAIVLRNDQQTGHHWLRVKLVDEATQRDAIGAHVSLQAGGATQRQFVNPTRSYASQSEITLTFGLGTTDRVDALTVTWPDGHEQSVAVDRVDRVITVERVAG